MAIASRAARRGVARLPEPRRAAARKLPQPAVEMKAGLDPVVNGQTATLILGSFPSEESLARQEYYANPRNQFWRLLGGVIGQSLADKPYSERLHALLSVRIGLWDVFHKCERRGSLDKEIRSGEVIDLSSLRRSAPSLLLVCFNGKTAAKFGRLLPTDGLEMRVLPSSSSALALPLGDKLDAWTEALHKRRNA